jgi:hypothetical protein
MMVLGPCLISQCLAGFYSFSVSQLCWPYLALPVGLSHKLVPQAGGVILPLSSMSRSYGL